jgi:peptidyl-prolyl cis-trans isomerase SurA
VLGPFRGPSGFQLLQLVDTRSAAAGDAQTVTQYQARHILVRGNDAAAKARIDTLRARIAGGADFVEVAKESSEDANSKSQGGDLGWFEANAFGPAFGKEVTGVADGGVSAPFRTEAGWHILQRVGQRQTDVTSTTQRAQVRETIGRRKLEDEYNRYLQELRGEAYVNVRNGKGDEAAAATTNGG